jgi:asparagine synthase (glutamine-hydrolysing)
MCGIAGFISDKDESFEEKSKKLHAMCEIMQHRGPDENGTLIRDKVALGMQRLAIIDLKGGSQPIFNEDNSLAIIFNGEIYNYRELKTELEKRNHKFKTNSDTETILHAYEEFGIDCVKHLRGMFAFAIYDFSQQSLFLARDRVGKKPLFYTLTPEGKFIFASELKSLLQHDEVKREIDPIALDSYLTFSYIPEEFCIFKNVKKLPPGSLLIYRNGVVRTSSYWDFNYDENYQIRDEREYVELLRCKIKDAVKVRLISEVPLGAFLSGGIDSSTIVAAMSSLLDRPVKTFSIGFNEDTFNELKFARITAERFQTEHHEFIVTPDLVKIADKLVWHFDEPFADSSALPTYMVSKMARDHVTVVLSGDGGDELFAGYTRYPGILQKFKVARNLPSQLKKTLRFVSEKLPHSAIGKYYLYNFSLDLIQAYVDSVSHFNTPRKLSLYSGDFIETLGNDFGRPEQFYANIANRVNSKNPLDKLLYLDSKTYLPSDILVKVDRMSMATSLEARAPLLDQELIEFVQKIPPEFKLKDDQTKYILKKAMHGILPDEILFRSKQGFGMPINQWINMQLRDRIHEVLTDRKTIERGYFNSHYIRTLLKEHETNRRDHSSALWILWMLELWHRQFIDTKPLAAQFAYRD